jgi:phosphoribosylformylglycinamidine (FGAM) synthase-like amidotransferase family enzyme
MATCDALRLFKPDFICETLLTFVLVASRTPDGRVLALMPHPERTILKEVSSYYPQGQAKDWGEFGPWVRVFKSARRWVG